MNNMENWDPKSVTDDQFFDDFFEDDEFIDALPLESEQPMPNVVSHKKNKKNKKIFAYCFSLFFALTLFFVNSYKIVAWFMDRQEVKAQINSIIDDTSMASLNIAGATASPDNTLAGNDDIYHKFLDTELKKLSFTNLKKKNKDTVAWLKVNGTSINYPIVQSSNNDYYLNHSYNKKANSAGWVFMDYRNTTDELGQNTIIYGHSLWNRLMFGSLSQLFHQSHYSNSNNKYITLVTPSYQYQFEIFSTYTIKPELYYLTTSFTTKSYKTFLNKIYNRSKIKFAMPKSNFQSILTLSTCYDDEKRLVVHALLVKKSKR